MKKGLLIMFVTILLLGSFISGFSLPSNADREKEKSEDDYKLNIQTAVPNNIYPLDESIDSNRAGTTDPKPGTHNYSQDTEITFKAIPKEGWAFTHWSGNISKEKSEEQEIKISIETNKNLTAHFSILDEDEYIGTEKDSYRPGEKIIVEVKNDGTANSFPIIVNFGIQIVDVEDDEIVYQPDIDVSIPAVPPYGRTELLIWNQTDAEGEQVPEGDYMVESKYNKSNYTVEFTISSEEDKEEETPGFTMITLGIALMIAGITYIKKRR
ncbi:MAG: hypothetical protein V5A76_00800 [Candidatus Thermoplasmatota archaeon]